MPRHPYFDLWLHETAELDALLPSPIVSRTTVHEWPLSCVQRLDLADGRAVIYKAQARPTIEPQFYAAARSPLLVRARGVDRGAEPAALLLDYVVGTPLRDLRPDPSEARRIGESLLGRIAAIADLPPLFADIGSEAAWGRYASDLLADLTALVERGTFRHVDRGLIDRLARQIEASAILEALRTPIGCVHSDLSAANTFVVADGYRVIDWQRPIRGPVLLDLVALLRALGVDPLLYVPEGIVQLGRFLSIAWCAQCALRWFPPGAETYDAAIVRLAAQIG